MTGHPGDPATEVEALAEWLGATSLHKKSLGSTEVIK
jgi:hypothetical protein